MNRTLSISENLYARLEREAQQRGFRTIEQLLEAKHSLGISPEDLHRRQEAVSQADAIRGRIAARYGEMSDSVPLIREDRER